MTEKGLAARLKALDGYHRVRWNYDDIGRAFYIFSRRVKKWKRRRSK